MATVDSDLWYLPWVAHEIEAPFDEDTPDPGPDDRVPAPGLGGRLPSRTIQLDG